MNKLIKCHSYQYWYRTKYNWIYDGIFDNSQHPQMACDCCGKARKVLHIFHTTTKPDIPIGFGTECVKNDFTEVPANYYDPEGEC